MSQVDLRLGRRRFLRGSVLTAAAGAMGALGIPGDARAACIVATPQEEADAFLSRFVEGWPPLQTAADEAEWVASTDVSEAHTAVQVAKDIELNRYVGAPEVIETVRRLLEHRAELNDLTAWQLEKIRLRAAEAPGTIPEVVTARAKAEAQQAAIQDSYGFSIRRQAQETTVLANDIDRILVESHDLAERRAAWEASKAIGQPLRGGLLQLRDLRNKVARAMGFDDFFALQVADYGMTVPNMIALCDRLMADVAPLYRQLHAWSRHMLAKRYQAKPPPGGKLPAHWLPNRWGQN